MSDELYHQMFGGAKVSCTMCDYKVYGENTPSGVAKLIQDVNQHAVANHV